MSISYLRTAAMLFGACVVTACAPVDDTGAAEGGDAVSTNEGALSAGTYVIVNVGSSRCMDVSGASTEAGANLQLSNCSSSKTQTWSAKPNSTGDLYTFKNGYSGLCLDIANGSSAAGAYAIQWSCNGQSSQWWSYNGSVLKNAKSGLVLDVSGGATASGSKLIQWTPTGSKSQIWNIQW